MEVSIPLCKPASQTEQIESCSQNICSKNDTRSSTRWRCPSFFLDTWFWECVSMVFSALCFISVMAVLAVYDGKSEPSLPQGITLNAIVSVLATGTKSSLLFVTGESIGQLKWIWFLRKRRVIDMQTFDNASRGPLGSFVILLQHRARSIASLGALITIMALVFDPFMQQILSHPTRLIASTSHQASVEQVFGDAVSGNWYVGEGLTALNAGIWTDNFDIIPLCPSGNCTWPLFQSLGYCTKCEDLTSRSGLSGCGALPSNATWIDMEPIECEIVLPPPRISRRIKVSSGIDHAAAGMPFLDIPADIVFQPNLTKMTPAPGMSYPVFAAIRAQIGLEERHSASRQKSSFLELIQVTECYMALCSRTYNISVSNGKPSIKTISEDYGTAFLDEHELVNRWKPTSYLGTALDSYKSKLEVHVADTYRKWGINPNFMDGSTIEQWLFHQTNLTWQKSYSWTASDTIQRLFQIGLESAMQRTAASVTKRSRDKSNMTAIGTVLVNESYVSVAWTWIWLPVVVLALTVLFFILTASLNRRKKNLGFKEILWKSSILPVLYHGLNETGIHDEVNENENNPRNKTRERERYMTLDQMEEAAESATVQLKISRQSGRLMLE